MERWLGNQLGHVVGNAPRSRIVALRFDADAVVHRSSNPLLTAEIPLGGLHGNVPEKELNLLQFPARGMTQLRA